MIGGTTGLIISSVFIGCIIGCAAVAWRRARDAERAKLERWHFINEPCSWATKEELTRLADTRAPLER